MLSVGIVGLPNVGKSTLFNAVTAGHAQVSNYPFTTIDKNVGVVPVPDPRLEELERLLHPEKVTPCCIQLVDIAGLVEGASRGEGLGNQFLGEIRSVDAIAHVLRCFEDPDVAHVAGTVDPVRDATVVETELLLADLEVLDRALARRKREWQTDPRQHAAERERLLLYRQRLEEGVPLRTLQLGPEDLRELKGLGLITGKPLLFVANVGEDRAADPAPALELAYPAPVLALSVRLEWELAQLDLSERGEFLEELGLEETGIGRLAAAAFDLLGLIRFYTVVKDKLQAWELPRGTHAPEAAGKVHTDMQEGFVRARLVHFEELVAHGSMHELQHRGLVRTEGKDYEIADGDVVEFLFT